jgi:hypothetical protein
MARAYVQNHPSMASHPAALEIAGNDTVLMLALVIQFFLYVLVPSDSTPLSLLSEPNIPAGETEEKSVQNFV